MPKKIQNITDMANSLPGSKVGVISTPKVRPVEGLGVYERLVWDEEFGLFLRFDFSSCPAAVKKALKTVEFLGSGFSSYTWGNAQCVVKASRDAMAFKFAEHMKNRPVPGIAAFTEAKWGCVRVWRADQEGNKIGRQKVLHLLVQERASKIKASDWRRVQNCAPTTRRKDKMWCHVGQTLYTEEKSLKCLTELIQTAHQVGQRLRSRGHPIVQVLPALVELRSFCAQNKNAGLDIDHLDNWGRLESGFCIIDPVCDVRLILKDYQAAK